VALGLAAGLLAALLFGVAAVAQAHAARRMPPVDGLVAFVGYAARDPLMLGVVAAYLAGFFLHAVAIWLLPLYLAQAVISLSMPITALAAILALHERLGPVRWAAVVLVSVGLALLAVGSGDAGTVTPTAGFALAIWAAAAVLLVTGFRSTGWGGAWLGGLSGTGYAGSAIAVRGLDTPVTAFVLVIALSVPLLGVVAFWIYSTALDRAAVTTATGPLIVAQTFVPAVVGVVALGDGVRSWPAAGLGLVLATAATVALSRED
jgi:drug/metabolite transporter (DMT)-like permease